MLDSKMLIAAENDAYSFSENDSKKLIAAGSDAYPLNEHDMITQNPNLTCMHWHR